MRSTGECLYCSSPANSLEHVLPAAFGEFVGAPNLDNRVCEDCNNKRLGVLDEQLARCGPEGFFRRWYGIEGRAHHDKVNPFYRGSAGGDVKNSVRLIQFGVWKLISKSRMAKPDNFEN